MGRCGGEDVERETLGRSHRSGMGHDGERDLLYIDLHLVHEVTSPQAFDELISWALGSSFGSDHCHRGPQHPYRRQYRANC
ncbi:isopropylmalate isomerase large subunit [Cutibacterium acnes HL005PA4]|nr:isopropylmalate isomerase large subunit [Cutibacterium acnes HL013PA1]EFS42729.1 isopropylmalate isomerase large subunit [Cutibacterium acnes HL110PA2]EFS64987.1 isopropylmalate isomerase large subunit [Cutibacterium acnes HL063PA2]EFS67648.1 isopropylmalate isomerase large subunit [Cutibacterium acnes HL007PA1]EFS78771.1 isopropylmalate isomerase large subunit [Cutibacterium acnes HL005PA4]EFT00701.1 isopropylmalate isomerase large subunit [Cutibacterium acnes HL027PA1]EFT22157.1 isopropy